MTNTLNRSNLAKLWSSYYGAIIGLALGLVFFLPYFWWPNFSGLNSDHAVPILMAEDFQFDRDWYYWGQNRLGSFFSLLAYLLTKLGLSLYSAAAISQLLILSASYLMLQALLDRPLFKIVLALALFLPIYPFTVQVMPGHPILAQTFFLAALIFCLLRGSTWWQATLLPLLYAGALWSSELSIVVAPVLLLVFYRSLWTIVKKAWWLLLLTSALGIYFLYYAKTQAVHIEAYSQWLADTAAIKDIFLRHLGDWWDFLRFQTNKPWNALLFYSLTIVLLWAVSRLGKWWQEGPLAVLFLGSAALAYLAVNFSHWNAIMDRPYHHLSPAYLFLILGLLYLSNVRSLSPWLGRLIALTVIVHGVASLYFIRNFPLKINGRINKEQTAVLLEQHRGRYGDETIGLVGNYWNVYLPDALSDQIRAIPYYGDLVRDFRFKEAVFAQDHLILMGLNWFDQYPEELEQHGYQLVKTGPCDTIGELDYCYYRLAQDQTEN